MIELYAKGTTDFTKHGIALAASQASVTYQDNGRFDMDLVMPYDSRIAIDYGMILRCPVPVQDIGAITLGTVSYWEVSAGLSDVPLYSEIPTRKRINYKAWIGYTATEGIHVYEVGDKVSYNGQNYACNYFDSGSLIANVPPNNSSWWDEIPNYSGHTGKIAATLDAGDRVVKTGDFSDTYMRAADTAGHEGFIEIAKCTDLSETDTRTVPAQHIEKQSFTITEITKSSDRKTVTIHAEHISYALGRVMLAECNISRANPATTVMFIRGAMQEDYPGEIETNLPDTMTVTGNYSWKNAQAAILDPKSGVLQATNGRIIRNDYNVYIIAEEEADPRYRISYGVNMKSLKWDGNVSDLVTRIYPLAQTSGGDTLLLPEVYIDSVRTVPFIRPEALNTGLKVGEKEKQEDGTEIELDEDTVFSRMREAANNRFNIDECDKVTITLDVDWLHMPDAEEYADYRALANAAPGEWVEVVNGPLGISQTIQMTGYTYDPIMERYTRGTFGKKKVGSTVASYDIQNGAVTGRAIASGSVKGSALQAGTITAREIEANSISSDKIASRSITTEILSAGAVTADEITAGAITTVKLAAGAVTADKVDAGAITADKIAAGAIDATKINTNAITAINAKLGTATITNGIIDNADISYANIVDASVQSLIARDAVTDKYFIDKLQVRNLQSVEATVGELVIKASDNKYYRLDVGSNGTLTPTEVTPTAAEIAAGVTSNGHGAIIETDLTVADLSASNIKGINALIDKLTASRIDVSELWARQAFINQLMVTDISSNTYIQSTIGDWSSGSTITQTISSLDSRISSLGYGTVYMQPEEPDHAELIAGDIWIQTQPSGTWEQVYQDYATWATIYNGMSTWQTLGGAPIMWVWDGRKWQKQLDSLEADTLETEIQQNAQQIALLATRTTAVEGDLNNKYTIRSGITITAEGIDISGSQYVKIASGGVFAVTTGNFGINSESSTYVLWAGAATAAASPFWIKKDGEIYAASGTIGGWSLAANSLSSGSGSTYMNINSNASNTYAMWAGAEAVANAPFRVKRDGTVYVTSLIAVGENGSETTVNLRTAGLWKLGYGTVKSVTVSGGYCTGMTFSNAVGGYSSVNFNRAAPVTLTGAWGGTGTSGQQRYTVTANTGESIYTTVTMANPAKGAGNFATKTITEFSDSHLAYVNISTENGLMWVVRADATSVYNSVGFASTGTWYNGNRQITLDNGETTTIAMPSSGSFTKGSQYGSTLIVYFTAGGRQYSGTISV